MITRFAPSPTGPLHLGHAYSSLVAFQVSQLNQGAFLVRIEDIDTARSRPEWEALIFEDLHWLGLAWDEPVLRQSKRLDAYDAALDQLWDLGLLYPCTCNRRDIREAASAPNEGDLLVGPDGIVYPGTCRPLTPPKGDRPGDVALRLNMGQALRMVENGQMPMPELGAKACTFPMFHETGHGPNGETGDIHIRHQDLLTTVGDVVLARKDMGTSYHLSVVVDDAFQEVSHIVRGEYLFEATQIHVLLQRLLGVPTPIYHHHRLIRDEDGKRLAKRHDSKAIRRFREEGFTPEDLKHLVNL